MKELDATNYMWVARWLEENSDPKEEFPQEIWPRQLHDGLYVCEFDLPIINESVAEIGNTPIEAVIKATDIGAAIIDKYLLNHKELKRTNPFINKGYVYEIDDNNNIISVGKSDKQMKNEDAYNRIIMETALETIKNAFREIKEASNGNKGIYIGAFPTKEFGKDLSKNELLSMVYSKMDDLYPGKIYGVNYFTYDESIIAVGYNFDEIND